MNLTFPQIIPLPLPTSEEKVFSQLSIFVRWTPPVCFRDILSTLVFLSLLPAAVLSISLYSLGYKYFIFPNQATWFWYPVCNIFSLGLSKISCSQWVMWCDNTPYISIVNDCTLLISILEIPPLVPCTNWLRTFHFSNPNYQCNCITLLVHIPSCLVDISPWDLYVLRDPIVVQTFQTEPVRLEDCSKSWVGLW